MVGAAIPDLNRLDLVFPAGTITGLPWMWGVTHRARGFMPVYVQTHGYGGHREG